MSEFKWLKKFEDRMKENAHGFQVMGGWYSNKNVVSAFDVLVDVMNMCLLDSIQQSVEGVPEDLNNYDQRKNANYTINNLITFAAVKCKEGLEGLVKKNFPNDPMITTKYVQEFNYHVSNELQTWFAMKWEEYDDTLDNIFELDPRDEKSGNIIRDASHEWQSKYALTVENNASSLKKMITDLTDQTMEKIKDKYKDRVEKKLKKLSQAISGWVQILKGVEEEHKNSDLKIALLELQKIVDKKSGKLASDSAKALKNFLKSHLRYWFVITKDSKFFVDPVNNSDAATKELVTNFIFAITENNSKSNIEGWFKSYKGK